MSYIIQDWTGTHIFTDETFESFEDGWEFIHANVDNSVYEATGKENDNEYQEYFVVEEVT